MRSNVLTLILGLAAPVAFACVIDEVDDSVQGGTSGSCEVGHEGCACTSGGSCNPGFECNQNQNICFLDTCPVGTETCDCTPKGGCDPDLQCASDICVDASCLPGTPGCPCTQGGGCDPDLVCLSDTCVDDSELDGTADDAQTCDADSCELWACGAPEPECACECVAGCTDGVATNCGDPERCVESEDCTESGGACEEVSEGQFGCATSDSTG